MVQRTEGLTVEIGADIADLKAGLEEAGRLGSRFSSSLAGAFEDVAFRGRSLSEAISGVALSLARSSLRSAAEPVGTALTSGLRSVFNGIGSAGLDILPFAKGGVFGTPSLAPLNGPRLGVIGEAGPEAVLPLTRGQDGRLGVRSEGQGGNVTVNFNVNTPDAASFARAETQVAAMLARAVDRGRRNL